MLASPGHFTGLRSMARLASLTRLGDLGRPGTDRLEADKDWGFPEKITGS